MKSHISLKQFAAAMVAAAFASVSPALLADQQAQPAQKLAWGYGMGPGMMGYYGMGPGMAVPYGGPGMGGGMQSPWSLDLTAEQQAKLNQIRDEARNKQWSLMVQMRDEMAKVRGLYAAKTWDEKAIAQEFEQFTKLRQQMFDNMMEARKSMEGVLSKEQLEKLRSFWPMAAAPAK